MEKQPDEYTLGVNEVAYSLIVCALSDFCRTSS